MKPDDKRTLEEFILGVIFPVVLIGTFLLFIFKLDEPPEQANIFKVVSSYNGCEVVKWTDPSNRYQYFLDCTNKQ
jgi:hypothetical protein